MSRQDKATTDRNARILRDLVKQPDNKNCADCRKNDARWAAWNLGVYLCIRCSGIHRSMGTHISKVKSIDLDIWTPEQMETIQKWGNRRANLYWEKHLKSGHVPPDHKIESFIRSKYESRRWAMDGPPPADPAELEQGGGSSLAPPVDTSTKPTPTSSAPAPAPGASRTHPLLSRTHAPKPSPAPAAVPVVDLFGSDDIPPPTTTAPPTRIQPAAQAQAPQPTAGAAPPAPTAAPTGSNLFDLDFKAPTPTGNRSQTAKADIMSLFSNCTSPSVAPTPTQNSFFNDSSSSFANWGGGITSSAPPQQSAPTQTPLPQANAGWGGMQMDQSAWGSPAQTQQAPQQQQQQQQPQQNQFGSNNTWASAASDPWASNGNGNSSNGGMGAFASAPPAAKKDDRDPFANLWS